MRRGSAPPCEAARGQPAHLRGADAARNPAGPVLAARHQGGVEGHENRTATGRGARRDGRAFRSSRDRRHPCGERARAPAGRPSGDAGREVARAAPASELAREAGKAHRGAPAHGHRQALARGAGGWDEAGGEGARGEHEVEVRRGGAVLPRERGGVSVRVREARGGGVRAAVVREAMSEEGFLDLVQNALEETYQDRDLFSPDAARALVRNLYARDIVILPTAGFAVVAQIVDGEDDAVDGEGDEEQNA